MRALLRHRAPEAFRAPNTVWCTLLVTPMPARCAGSRSRARPCAVPRASLGACLASAATLRNASGQRQALAERNVQLALAGKAGLVGSYAYDVDTERMQISEGYAAIQGYPEGTAEITRSAWLAGAHPEDVERLDVLRSQAFRERQREYNMEYRIVRSVARFGGSNRAVSFRTTVMGSAQRVIGVNIDVTERKQTEALLNESKARLADALAAGQVMAFEWDAVTRSIATLRKRRPYSWI